MEKILKISKNLTITLIGVCTIIICTLMLPVIICPVMWMIFGATIIAQLSLIFKGPAKITKLLTVFVFLLIAFRIYKGYVTDFTIVTPHSMGLKFIILATTYGLASIMVHLNVKRMLMMPVIIISLASSVTMIITGMSLIREMHYEAFERFKIDNPNCVALINPITYYYKGEIEKKYLNILGENKNYGMITHQTKTPLGCHLYRFTISDGSNDKIPLMLSIDIQDTFGIELSSILFRYEPILKYGYLQYKITENGEKVFITEKDSTLSFFESKINLLPQMAKL